MEGNAFGEIIWNDRKQRGISQGALCRGICSPAMMSRIEHGEKEITVLMAQIFLERLGLDIGKFEIILNAKEFERYRQRQKIDRCIKEKDVLQAEKELALYERTMEQEKLHVQYVKSRQLMILYLKIELGVIGKTERKRLQEQTGRLLQEIGRMTVPYFDENQLLSRTEIWVFVELAKQNPPGHLKYIHKFVKDSYSTALKSEIYPLVQLEYAKVLAEAGEYEKALKQVREGLEDVQTGKSYQYCADLHFLSTQIVLIQKGNQLKEEEREACQRQCMLAYRLYEFDQDPKALEVQGYLEGVLKWGSIVKGN